MRMYLYDLESDRLRLISKVHLLMEVTIFAEEPWPSAAVLSSNDLRSKDLSRFLLIIPRSFANFHYEDFAT